MGKARRTRQGIMIRLDENDAELEQWLGQFARSQTMTKVVKLACYLLAGLEAPEGLRAMLPQVEQTEYAAGRSATRSGVPAKGVFRGAASPGPREPSENALAQVMQELAALRQAMAAYGAGPGTWSRDERGPVEAAPEATSGLTPSGGLDMSSRRRRGGGTPPPGGRASLEYPGELQPGAASAQVLINSIRAFGDDFQKGR